MLSYQDNATYPNGNQQSSVGITAKMMEIYIMFIRAYCAVFVIISCIACVFLLGMVGSYGNNQLIINDDKFVSMGYDIELRNQSNNKWHRYRLGDMVRWKNHAADEQWGYKYHKLNFPHSIATQYLSYSNATRFNDYKLLLQIVRNRTINSSATALINSIDYNDMLIIHLRTGDVIDDYDVTVDDIMDSKEEPFYYRGRSYYIGVINQFKHRMHKALFLTGWHQGSNHTKSTLYIQQIMRLFALNGYQTSLRINNNPDDDFLIMCNSKYFVMGGGGFSLVIAKVVKLNGGKVYN